jgi:hypothetical protein
MESFFEKFRRLIDDIPLVPRKPRMVSFEDNFSVSIGDEFKNIA